MHRLLSGFVCTLTFLTPGVGFALCSGTDLRPNLPPDQQSEIVRYVEDTPYATGNHWRAKKDDEILHIIGTMHFSDPRMDRISQALTPQITESSLLLLEATSEDTAQFEQRLASDPSLILMQSGKLSDHLSQDAWNNIMARLTLFGLTPDVIDRLQPWYAALMISLPDCLLTDPAASHGLDKRVEDIALEAGIPARRLEPADTIVHLFGAYSLTEQVEMLEMANLQLDGIADQTATLIEAYFDERPAQGWILGKIIAEEDGAFPQDRIDQMFDQTQEVFLTTRNQNWLPVILNAVETETAPITIAVGGAHLMGKMGLLALLEAEGFTLTRQPF